MKLTKESLQLNSFLLKLQCITPIKQTALVDNYCMKMYREIVHAIAYLESMKRKHTNEQPFYNATLTTKNTTSTSHVWLKKPKTFFSNPLPPTINSYIDETIVAVLEYRIALFGKTIHILFFDESVTMLQKEMLHHTYVDRMLVWLCIATQYASSSCSKQLTIYVYLTSLKKELPNANTILNEMNVNTAFTKTCPATMGEIVIFRKEEWFKVFIHETFHNLGLDFSGMNLTKATNYILDIFPVQSEVNLYEAYTEFWARIWNCAFVSYYCKDTPRPITSTDFLSNMELFLNLERKFSYYQVTKVLNYMGLEYDNLYSRDAISDQLRKEKYREKTSVLAYYMFTLILLNEYPKFLSWCNKNNGTTKMTAMVFKKTQKNVQGFCEFIEQYYQTSNLLSNLDCVLPKLASGKRYRFLENTLRMTACELL